MIVKSDLAYILLPLNDSAATIGSAIGASAAKLGSAIGASAAKLGSAIEASAAKLGSGLGAHVETSGLPPANGKPDTSLGQLLVDMLQEGAGNSSNSRQVKT
jgi:hypothetical protein